MSKPQEDMVPFRIQFGNLPVQEGMAPISWIQKLPTHVKLVVSEGSGDKEKIYESEDLPLQDVATEEKDEMLRQLLYTQTQTKVIPLGNIASVRFTNLSKGDNLDNAILPKNVRPPERALPGWASLYHNIALLARVITEFNGEDWTSLKREEKEEKVRNLDDMLGEYLLEAWNDFQAQRKELFRPEVLFPMVEKS